MADVSDFVACTKIKNNGVILYIEIIIYSLQFVLVVCIRAIMHACVFNFCVWHGIF